MASSKVDELKSKIRSFVQKQHNKNLKIPSMGFVDIYANKASTESAAAGSSSSSSARQQQQTTTDVVDPSGSAQPDQEILESTEEIYFKDDIDSTNVALYELAKLSDAHTLDSEHVEAVMMRLRGQHKVVSKRVMQMILEKRPGCNDEFQRIGETEKLLQESVWQCQKTRSYLSFARQQLATTNLEMLATYKRRELLLGLLTTLKKIKTIKTMSEELQQMLDAGEDYPGAIALLLSCRESTVQLSEYTCVESLSQKLQDILMLTEVQLDKLLNDMCTDFDSKKYTQLQESYRLLAKSQISMDQLHINFISVVHSTAYAVLQEPLQQQQQKRQQEEEPAVAEDSKQKLLFEELCEQVPLDKYIPRLITLCKSFWKVLSCYYQVTLWHQNCRVFSEPADQHLEEYVREKLKSGQLRLWNDVQAKISTYLKASSRVHQLKFEQFIQVLSIVQRLKKVGQEFCGDASPKLMDTIRIQSEEYFRRYHATCLDEIGLFLDNEAWVAIDSFSEVGQLQEFKSMRQALRRYQGHNAPGKEDTRSVQSLATLRVNNNNTVGGASPQAKVGPDNDSSAHSQDESSSIYAFCGYFLRFSEKSSPFDGGFDEAMLQEDILSGIADETSCYFSEESDEDGVTATEEKAKSSGDSGPAAISDIVANNTMLTVLRFIGKYLQMCRLLHVVAPQIVHSITELIDFYIFVVHELFAKDLPVSSENLYSASLSSNIKRIFETIIPKLTHWPVSRAMVDADLNSADDMFGCQKRIVAVESAMGLLQQLDRLKAYIGSLMPALEKEPLERYCVETRHYVTDLRTPVYMCIAARFVDIQSILVAMSKVKWDLNHVTVQYSPYVDIVNRIVQTFAMRLGELWQRQPFHEDVKCQLWDCVAHVVTHVLVEGYASAKNCSTGGRALMQIDYTHIMSFLELISDHKYTVHQQYVDQYVKAYYLPKDGALKEWLEGQVTRNEYSVKHLNGLVLCTCANDKKNRQRLLAVVTGGGGGPTGTKEP